MLHDAKVERERLAALQEAGQTSVAQESLLSGTGKRKADDANGATTCEASPKRILQKSKVGGLSLVKHILHGRALSFALQVRWQHMNEEGPSRKTLLLLKLFMGMLQASQPIVKPTEECKVDQGHGALKNTAQADQGKRMKENKTAKEFTAKDVLKHYKNDRGRAIAKGLALKKQRDLAARAALQSTKADLQAKLKVSTLVQTYNAVLNGSF